jgi:hypothetical protein
MRKSYIKIVSSMQPWKEQSLFAKFLWVDYVGKCCSRRPPEVIGHLSPSMAFMDHSTSLALLSRAQHSVQLLSCTVRPATQLSYAVSELEHDNSAAMQCVGFCTAADQRFELLNPIRQKSLLFPLFRYPGLHSDYCCGNIASGLYPLLYLAHLYAVGIVVELAMPEVEFPTLARGLMDPMESTLHAISSLYKMSEGGDLVDELVMFPRFIIEEFRRRGKGIMKRFI